MALLPPLAYASPQGGAVIGGSAGISVSGDTTTVAQSSARALIEWNSFNVGAHETVRFVQPDASSITMNRVLDASPSLIDGAIAANGQVWISNRHGVVFGQNAQVNVGGLLATTTDIGNADFMNGSDRFTIAGDANASIENHGRITAADGGIAALVAPTVRNDGVITARLGKIDLASGDTFTFDPYGDGLINVQASPALTRQLIENGGDVIADGGTVRITAAAAAESVNSLINLTGLVQANSVGAAKGKVAISGRVIDNTGTIRTNGDSGGDIAVSAKNISQQGSVTATGATGDGGSIAMNFSNAYMDSEQSLLSAASDSGRGGSIRLDGAAGSSVFASGAISGTGAYGGTIDVEASRIRLYGARLDVSGDNAGGMINIGGMYQGAGTMMHADLAHVNYSTTLKADARVNGDGGRIILWSDGDTGFAGKAYARGGALGGNGGLIETSSSDDMPKISPNAVVDASATNGNAGTWLLDPKNITIATGGISGSGLSSFELVDPNADTGTFGTTVVTLSSGNVVVTDSTDDFAATDAGAVYLFNGATGALISTLRGSTASDFVGGGVTALSNGNYVVTSLNWDNGAVTNVGAVTWGNGSTGVSGAVSSANSLVGSTASDQVGNLGVTALTNGNYVVSSSICDNGAVANAGAVTWGNGTTGVTGAVSSANSLVGSTTSDQVGNGGAIALTNGNYVVSSSAWDNGAVTDAGAVTWGNGTTGISGAVSSSNSLVGSTASDGVGSGGLLALTNGNYLALSVNWDNAAITNAGAITWGDGTTGITGTISASNSQIGGASGDQFGAANGTTALTNGNYVTRCTGCDINGVSNSGAVVWGNGSTGSVGTIGTSNSLYGTTTNDNVGSGITALSNGNYVVRSTNWDDGAVGNAGAVTWGNGATGITGAVSSANSLVGSTASDSVGGSITALSNGNYVVSSASWDNGAVADAGAVTWGNGSTGITGAVSSANSLVGSTASDQVGNGGAIALTNGNYVVRSTNWDNGAVANVGAATWGNGTTGTTGTVSSANSLVGSTTNDNVGNSGIIALTNGNYVVSSSLWNNGAVTDAGAVTWGNGTTGTTGTVSSANSLVGSTANDNVGSGSITALTNGNYVVRSANWDDGAVVNAGAATLGDGTAGVTGTISSTNSIIGPSASAVLGTIVTDTVNSRFLARFTTAQRIYSVSTTPSGTLGTYDSFSDSSTGSVTLAPSFITAALNAGTNVTLQASNDITVTDAVTANNPGGNGGAFTLQAGRSILFNADITTDNGNFTAYANSPAADGVIDAQRDAGDAVITMANGTTINAGTGAVDLQIKAGTGNTNTAAGDLTLVRIVADTIFARNISASDDLILRSGASLNASAAGTALTLVSGRNFLNNSGSATPFTTAAGRSLVYSTDPAADTLSGLTSAFTLYSCAYSGSCPALSAGNGLLYSIADPSAGGGGSSSSSSGGSTSGGSQTIANGARIYSDFDVISSSDGTQKDGISTVSVDALSSPPDDQDERFAYFPSLKALLKAMIASNTP